MSDEYPVTHDAFLGGRITLIQPQKGYRAGTDAVLLAAAVPAGAGQTALELGCGTGAAALCLATRVKGVKITGVEAQDRYARLARQSAQHNGLPIEVVTARIEELPSDVTARNFDHVFANPPYFSLDAVTPPVAHDKSIAHSHEAYALAEWITVGKRRLNPGGTLTLIHRTEALTELLMALANGFGDVEVIPISSRPARAATRVILRARKGRKGPLSLHAPLVMHAGGDGNAFSQLAREILETGRAIN